MLSFIILSSNENNRKRYNNIINKTMMNEELYYDVNCFDCINKRFNELCKINSQSTVFIMDDCDDINTIEVVTKIRKEYNLITSFIIIIDKDKKYDILNLASEFSFLIDIIHDETNKEKQIEKDLKYILGIVYSRKKTLTFFRDKIIYKIPYSDILYIEKEVNGKKCKIVTKKNTYYVSKSLCEIVKELDERFCFSHQSALINIKNVEKIDFDKNKIFFSNDIICTLLSRNNKKELKQIFTK